MSRSGFFMILALAAVAADADGGDLPLKRGLDTRLSNFTLSDVLYKDTTSLYGNYGKKGVVLVFTGVDCPVGNLYIPRLIELNDRYKDKGIVFLAINSNKSETVKQIADHAKQMGLNFPVLKDKDSSVADMAQAERTNEVLLLDGISFIRYRGAIDNQYTQTAKKAAPTENYLADAIEALLAGRNIELKATEVAGCPIERAEATVKLPKATLHGPTAELMAEFDKRDGKVEVGAVTYAGEVALILQDKCQQCHRPGQPGPFSLLSYDDARRWFKFNC